jgi:hypothetical protein
MKNDCSLPGTLGADPSVSRRAATNLLNSMLRPAMLMLLAWLCLPALAQTGEWTWVGGSSTLPSSWQGQPGVYGTLGTPAAGNTPGSRAWFANCTDNHGNFWLFGGWGYDSAGNAGLLNDLWVFNPSTNQWTWMGGASTLPTASSGGWPGVYGALGKSAAKNVPGGRVGTACSIDPDGNFWLFGGAASMPLASMGRKTIFGSSTFQQSSGHG